MLLCPGGPQIVRTAGTFYQLSFPSFAGNPALRVVPNAVYQEWLPIWQLTKRPMGDTAHNASIELHRTQSLGSPDTEETYLAGWSHFVVTLSLCLETFLIFHRLQSG